MAAAAHHGCFLPVSGNGGALTYDYTTADSDGKVSRITDPHGRTIDITYNAAGKPTAAADFTGRTVSYEYDAAGNLTLATDMDGAQTVYAYDAQGLMTGVSYPNGAHKAMTYDAQRRVLSITEDNGNNAQTFDYQDISSRTIVTDALGRQTVYDYITVDGRREVTKITAPDGTVTKYGYDGELNRISVTDALNRETTMEYGRKGNMIAARDPAGNTTRLSYEPTYNQPLTVTDPKGASTGMRYDIRGNLMEVTDALGNKTEMSYDALGHVTGTKDPFGNVTLFEYDSYGALGKVTDPLNRITLMTRDNLSRVTQTRDPSNKLTLFDYDVKGNLTKVTDALNGITEYGYTGGCAGCGGGDLLASVKDAKNQLTSFQYDLQKRLTGTTNPLSQSKTFAYDKKGNLTSVTDAKSQTITFEYDVNDRLTVKHLPEGDITYSYDPVGNLLSVTSPDSQVNMTYGILNQVVQVQQVTGGQTYTLSYGYDVNGNRTSMTSPWGTTSYTYDALNRLTSLTNPDGKLITFAYDALGRRTRLTYPNGTETTYAYDAASQLTQVLHRKVADSTALAFNNYAYDLAGNRTGMQDLTGSHGYGYDDLHRLVSASHPTLPNEAFAYDAVGNRTSDAVMTNYQHNAANRLLENSSYTYTYDNNGNQTGQTHKITSEHTAYAYTTENQLKQATLPGSGGMVTFKYDPLGRRIEKVTPAGTFRYVYDNEDIIAVLDGNNTLKQNITHGPGIDEPLIMKSSTSANYYYHADGLGSIIALSNETGEIVETYEYQAYGKPTIKDHTGAVFDASPVGNFYLFTAREYDYETGLFYYRARYYNAEIGRFQQEDPIGFKLFDTLLYQYVLGAPVKLVDPFGLDVFLVEYPFYSYYHQGVVIGDSEHGYMFFHFGPKSILGGAWSVIADRDVSGEVKKICGDAPGSKIKGKIKTSHERDLELIKYATKLMQDPRWSSFNAYRNNCWDFALELFSYASRNN